MVVTASIVIRTKNEGRSLGAVLTQVAAQTYSDHEVIVVDSGSTDDTLQIARDYHARVICIAPEGFSYGAALNMGLSQARGEFGVSLAGHALPANPHWLAELLVPLSEPAVVGTASRQLTGGWLYRSWALAWFDFLYCRLHQQGAEVANRLFVNSSSAVRLEYWRQAPFCTTLASCEDQLWGRQARLQGKQIVYCPRSLVHHCHHLTLAQKVASVRRDMAAMRQISREYHPA